MIRDESTHNISIAVLLATAYVVVCTAVPGVPVPSSFSPGSPVAAQYQRLGISRLFSISPAEHNKKKNRVNPVAGFVASAAPARFNWNGFDSSATALYQPSAEIALNTGATDCALISRYLAAS